MTAHTPKTILTHLLWGIWDHDMTENAGRMTWGEVGLVSHGCRTGMRRTTRSKRKACPGTEIRTLDKPLSRQRENGKE
jgi:hypothetical protein